MPFNHCDRVDKVLASLLIWGENRAGGSDEREGGGGGGGVLRNEGTLKRYRKR